ncbi:MAG: alpha-glucan family phosphorylase [Candidatus Delongbacteria bacterium]|nr:alpha-glucan family phosphorylase [Candidatus Delongbacteria bacterium]MCG2761379.1 alpha-glucan family phosphorylase [Candidatus Delongbacteria bacterium]
MKLKNFYVKPIVPESLKPLYEISYNMWSTWDKEAERLFRRTNPELFREVRHNPVEFLHRLSFEDMENLSKDNGFLYELDKVYDKYKRYISFEGYYTDKNGVDIPADKNNIIAYFSMEFGMHEAIAIYSGGLGVLAGDYLKAASDIGIPLYGIGLLYTYGYMNQRIAIDGLQQEEYLENKWYLKPIKETVDDAGEPLLFPMKIKCQNIWIKIWEIDVGKIKLYLLDTNIPQNDLTARCITDHLYIADKHLRIQQEIILGQGGMKALDLLGIKPRVFHLNEGHSAFLIIERMKKLMLDQKMSFEKAKQLIIQSTVFTTHTPVIEGNEHFDESFIREYFREDIDSLGITMDRFLQCGKVDGSRIFWLPIFAIKYSKFRNGVSKLHGKVSRQMWKDIFPYMHDDEVPIDFVTNGVHLQTWLSTEITYLFDRYLGPDYMHKATNKQLWDNISVIPNNEIWEAHKRRKEQLITFVRKKIVKTLQRRGAPAKSIKRASNVLNPQFLTIGFARRFATYKRANLLLQDIERLKNILTNPQRPVQIIFAGKAHPADIAGKTIIKDILNFAVEHDLENHIVFVEDYDIDIARHMVQGVDVWLNNPIKPMEASGTSGIKAGINGVLNLSVLDGWWPECYNGKNGWAITAGDFYSDMTLKTSAEAQQIYDLLEEEITEKYYDKGESYYPEAWVEMMKNSIFTVGKGFNMHRMLSEYFNKFYAKEFNNLDILEKNNYKKIDEFIVLSKIFNEKWHNISIKDAFASTDSHRINSSEKFTVEVYAFLDNVSHEDLSVELFYYPDADNCEIIKLSFVERYADNVAKYTGQFSVAGSGEQGYNIRVRPENDFFFELYPEYVKWFVI